MRDIKPNKMFYISMVGASFNASSEDIKQLLDDGKINEYIAAFLNGIQHQTHHQTRDERPLGSNTAIRIADELCALLGHLGKDVSSYDIRTIGKYVNLDKYKD